MWGKKKTKILRRISCVQYRTGKCHTFLTVPDHTGWGSRYQVTSNECLGGKVDEVLRWQDSTVITSFKRNFSKCLLKWSSLEQLMLRIQRRLKNVTLMLCLNSEVRCRLLPVFNCCEHLAVAGSKAAIWTRYHPHPTLRLLVTHIYICISHTKDRIAVMLVAVKLTSRARRKRMV